jgi:hypothetical protein
VQFLYFITPRSVATENCRRELNHAIAEKRDLLAVYLESTEVPGGIRLHLHNRQAILKHELQPDVYAERLLSAVAPTAREGHAVAPQPSAGHDIPPPSNSTGNQSFRIAAALTAAVAIVALAWWLTTATPDGVTDEVALMPPVSTIPAIAVLPFKSMADAQSEDPVIAHSSTFTFKGRDVDIKEVGKALGAGYVVEGLVRRSADQLRVTARLLDATTGYLIWSETYDRVFSDVFKLQDDITSSIAAEIAPEIQRSEITRVSERPETGARRPRPGHPRRT